MESTNAERRSRGKSLQDVLGYFFDYCKELDYIVDYSPNYHKGMPGYADKEQFKAPYIIEFHDKTNWLVFTTTSLRDRIKEQYWDAQNLKQLNNKITEAYLVYPDVLSDSEKKKFKSANERIKNKAIYSTLDGLLSQDSFFNRIEEKAISNLSEWQKKVKQGKSFEHRVAATLKNPINLEKWKTDNKIIEGLHYHMFEMIMATFGIEKNSVQSIKSTSDLATIGSLPGGGEAKTDVLSEITFTDGTAKYYTISCKRSSKKAVTVHQGTANGIADALDANNSELRRVLIEFQRAGSRDKMNENDALILEEQIQAYIMPLCDLALGGYGGKGDPQKQWANYLIIYDNNTESSKSHTTKAYCELLANDSKRAFNTPFSWSYQGDRGKSIQLTCPINLE